jgi:acetylornithine deacetylase
MPDVPLATLLHDLVAIDSVNPTLVSGGAGEAEIAAYLAGTLRQIGLDVETPEAAPGRPNVLAVLPGRRPAQAPALLLCGHTDTVGTSGMTIDPFEGRIEGDRVYGRGAIDMKAGVAAIVEAARALAATDPPDGDLVLAFVADEEDRSLGVEHLVGWLRGRRARPAAGIITEPTDLAVMHAHKGFSWGRVETVGRAAHGSDHGNGVDAIALMGRVIARLETLDRNELPTRTHPLLGRGSLHCSLIQGGTGLSTYPDRCTLDVERRTLPGETRETLRREVEGILRDLGAEADFEATYTHVFDRLPLEVPEDAPIVQALDEALGSGARHEGVSGWTDAQILDSAGIPTVLFGPGSEPEPGGEGGLNLAHAAVEYASLSSTETCARLLVDVARRFWRSHQG